jgi:hypothetical protein
VRNEKAKSYSVWQRCIFVGQRQEGHLLLAESPSWDCGWYWGFGYVECYTNNKHPNRAKDINHHQHFNGLIWNKVNGHYCATINDEGSPFIETVLTNKEAWELSDLMKSFYTLKEAAATIGRGSSHYTSNVGVNFKDKSMADKINHEFIPKVTARVLELLTPEI